jgi:hypothetical protein
MANVRESANLGQQRTVSYGALAEERARRKELQRELQSATESSRGCSAGSIFCTNLHNSRVVLRRRTPAVKLLLSLGGEPPYEDPAGESPISEVEA